MQLAFISLDGSQLHLDVGLLLINLGLRKIHQSFFLLIQDHAYNSIINLRCITGWWFSANTALGSPYPFFQLLDLLFALFLLQMNSLDFALRSLSVGILG